MLRMVNENLNAISYVTVGDNDRNVMSLSGNIDNTNNTYNINKSILDSKLYLANKEACDKDYNDFEEKIIASLE